MLKSAPSDQISFRVRYGETDQMGVVYHGNYAQYLEMGRIAWLRNRGISYRQLETDGIMLPVIDLKIKFLKSALFDDVIKVSTKLQKPPAVRIVFTYEVRNGDNELLALAETTLAFMDKDRKRPIKCPDFILERL